MNQTTNVRGNRRVEQLGAGCQCDPASLQSLAASHLHLLHHVVVSAVTPGGHPRGFPGRWLARIGLVATTGCLGRQMLSAAVLEQLLGYSPVHHSKSCSDSGMV